MCTRTTCFLLHALATRQCFVEFLEVVNFCRMAKPVSLNPFAGPWAKPDELMFFRFPGRILASFRSIGQGGIRGCGALLFSCRSEQVIELGIVRQVDWKQLGTWNVGSESAKTLQTAMEIGSP